MNLSDRQADRRTSDDLLRHNCRAYRALKISCATRHNQTGKYVAQQNCAIKLLNFVACLTWALRFVSSLSFTNYTLLMNLLHTHAAKHTPSNCSTLHVNIWNVVYLHKNSYRSARRRQQVAVKFQPHSRRHHTSKRFDEMPASRLQHQQPHQLGHSENKMHIHIFDYRRVHPRIRFCKFFYKLLHKTLLRITEFYILYFLFVNK